MSLIGIDIGSSAVKAVAYRASGSVLARAHEAAPSLHPAPGWWEIDGDEVWRATVRVVRRLASGSRLRHDPPAALAVSASGRESFPARADGRALGPCLRTADGRRPEPEAAAILGRSRERWIGLCGHVPDHMDPTNRLLWWRQTAPRTLDRARWFLGWHELASLRLVGRPVIDPALASGFLAFDLASGTWSADRLGALGLDQRLLPEVVPWGTPLGRIRPRAAGELGLPSGCVFVVGSWDASCAAVGSAVVQEGDALVSVGTWESVVAPLARPHVRRAAAARLAITPQPSTPGKGLWARSPNGTSVVSWARTLTRTGLSGMEAGLRDAGPEPSPVLVVPHLSGAPAPWPDARRTAGAVLGLTLATSPLELVKATMEGVACELSFAIDALRGAGAPIRRCRVAGGGARSAWWMQLKADLLGMPVEVPSQAEPGTFGAALLAGVGVGTYACLAEAAERVAVTRRFDPDPARGATYRAKVERHRAAVEELVAR
jgi:xylulokinase